MLLALAAQGAVAPPPPGGEYFPRQAVDHVVVMEDWRGDCSNCPVRRRTITRSGNWLKDELVEFDGVVTTYSDFRSGTTFTLHLNREGVPENLVVERNFHPDGQYQVHRQPTGRRDSNLGQPCAIWTVSSALLQTATESCETSDGIVLWRRWRDRVSPRALSVERRAVRAEEVRPPPNLFALVRWPRFDPAVGTETGYEVVLTSRSRGRERTSALRRQGNLTSNRQDGRDDDGVYYSAGDGTVHYTYHVDERGRATKLEVGVRGLLLGGEPRWEAVPGRRPQRILGETCIWQDYMTIRSTDIRYYCRTADDVLLMTETRWHWTGETEIERARSLVRRPLTESDLAPPPEAVEWANWGVTSPEP